MYAMQQEDNNGREYENYLMMKDMLVFCAVIFEDFIFKK